MRQNPVLMSIVISALMLALAAKAGFAQGAGDTRRGAAVAGSQCVECHGVTAGQRSPKTAAPSFEVIAATPGMTTLALEAALGTSHRQMPNVMLESADRSDVIAYILSLKDKK